MEYEEKQSTGSDHGRAMMVTLLPSMCLPLRFPRELWMAN